MHPKYKKSCLFLANSMKKHAKNQMAKKALLYRGKTAAFRNRTEVSRGNRIRYRGSEQLKLFLHLRTAVLPRYSAVPRPAGPRVTLYLKPGLCILSPKPLHRAHRLTILDQARSAMFT